MTLTEIRDLTGLPFKSYNGMFVAPCYIDGSSHSVFNKTFTSFYDGSWWINEQGGDSVSLQQWLKLYGDGTKLVTEREIEEPPKIERKFVDPSVYEKTFPEIYSGNLFLAMSRMFGIIAAHHAFKRYSVGESNKRDTVFWYRNESEQWLHDSVVPYMKNGHRDKSLSVSGWRKCKSNDGYTGRGVFGQHLLKNHTGEVCVVESEKTALIMSLADTKGRLWLATGGSMKTAHIRDGWLLFPDFDEAGKFWECLGCSNRNKPGCIIETVMVEGRKQKRKKWGCQFRNKEVKHWFKGLVINEGCDVADWVIKNNRK